MWWETQARRARGEAERALELGAARPARGRAAGDGQRERAGAVAARAPQRQRAARATTRTTESSVRVWIGRSWSRNSVGDAAEPLAGVVVLVGDRLVGEVAAGHHQRLADVGEQQVVQRRVRQHHAELAAPRRDRGGDARAGPPRREHDRPLAPAQQRRLGVAELAQRPRRLEVGAPSARTASPRGACAPAARATAPLVGRAAGEMVPAEPLHRHDPARLQHAPPRRQRVCPRRRPARRVDQAPARARRSGQALGWAWKRRSAGSWYSAAQRCAHREAGHRGAAAGRRARRGRS